MSELVFTAPWALLALLGLPALFWLLRLMPPAAKKIDFPALILLQNLAKQEEKPAHTPWWLLLCRLAIAALLILAASGPVSNPPAAPPGSGPLILVVDNGWAAARHWPARQEMLQTWLRRAEMSGREVILMPSAATGEGLANNEDKEPSNIARLSARSALAEINKITALPYITDHAKLLRALEDLPRLDSHSIWLSDGIETDTRQALAKRLLALGSLDIHLDDPSNPALLLRPPQRLAQNEGLKITLLRAPAAGDLSVPLRFTAASGEMLATLILTFKDAETSAQATLKAPANLINQIAEISASPKLANTVFLTDQQWQKRKIGLVSASGSAPQPFISGNYFIEKALAGSADIWRGTPIDLLAKKPDILLLDEGVMLSRNEQAALQKWLSAGGLLIRFASDALAEAPDDLLPMPLHPRLRNLGGSLSWQAPLKLGKLCETCPLAGLTLPEDVRIQRQALAARDAKMESNITSIWLTAEDGTPLISAQNRGQGLLVFFHTGSAPAASSLPLSGLFVQILNRLLPLAAANSNTASTKSLPLYQGLDAYGTRLEAEHFKLPDGSLPKLSHKNFPNSETKSGPPPTQQTPPGLYGTGAAKFAHNLGAVLAQPQAAENWPRGAEILPYAHTSESKNLAGLLLFLASLLFLLDFAISLYLRGQVPAASLRARHMKAILIFCFFATALPANAQEIIPAGAGAALHTTLAYLKTGNPEQDKISEAGLQGLIRTLLTRTALNDVVIAAVRPEIDDLAFYPLIYWPLAVSQNSPFPQQQESALNDVAMEKLNAYMRNGGLLIIDLSAETDPSTLRRRTAGLSVPPLQLLDDKHVLSRTFYLLKAYPGRYAESSVWVAASDSANLDGVSPLVLTANRWAEAWAIDARGRYLFSPSPGGEEQREQALRMGVNLILYALTGTYKNDQVHVSTLLERLPQ